ncbi:MAG: hypothetical protein WA055_05345 [Candidatus Moraniibacteriota bacterium]
MQTIERFTIKNEGQDLIITLQQKKNVARFSVVYLIFFFIIFFGGYFAIKYMEIDFYNFSSALRIVTLVIVLTILLIAIVLGFLYNSYYILSKNQLTNYYKYFRTYKTRIVNIEDIEKIIITNRNGHSRKNSQKIFPYRLDFLLKNGQIPKTDFSFSYEKSCEQFAQIINSIINKPIEKREVGKFIRNF